MKLVYITACVLMMFGIVAVALMQYHAGLGATIMAEATAEHARAGTDADFSGAKASSIQHARISDQYGIFSLILAGLGVMSWIISLFGQHHKRVVVPVVLLIIYIATYLLMV